MSETLKYLRWFHAQFRCWMFHEEHWVMSPIYHSWHCHCMKCGRDWVIHD